MSRGPKWVVHDTFIAEDKRMSEEEQPGDFV